MTLSRRDFCRNVATTAVTIPLLQACNAPGFPFRHGVASGDPLSDRVILWTRITPISDEGVIPDTLPEKIPYTWSVALDPQMSQIISGGQGETTLEKDYTVKIDADGLLPNTTYYYQFNAIGFASDVGRTKTLPVGHVGHIRMAFTSCSNYPYGYFNAYGAIAQRKDLDVVLHLGDYIYEYADGEYGSGAKLGRVHAPDKETVSLSDYRIRHAQYKTDPDLQEAHRQHPFIVVWDDHETANNSYVDGAENHQPNSEGDWTERKLAAIQAYFEWMPIREQMDAHGRIYRDFRFGDLVDLIMLDTRIEGRDKQIPGIGNLPGVSDPNRTLLGFEQEDWLYNKLSKSQQDGQRWRLLGQQVMVGQLGTADLAFNMDQWDGYRANRDRLFNHIIENEIDNIVVLTGDIHSSWATEITPTPFRLDTYNPFTGEGAIAVEFVTPGVTSPGIPDKAAAALVSASLNTALPHVKYTDFFHRGYVLLDITHERTQAEWHVFEDVEQRSNRSEFKRAYRTYSGENHLTRIFRESDEKQHAPDLAPAFSLV